MAKHGVERQRSEGARNKRQIAHDKRIVGVLRVFVIIVVAFCAGFMVRGNTDLMNKLGISIDGQSAADAASSLSQKTAYSSLALRVNEIEDVIKSKSVYTLDVEDATDNVVDALSASSGDSYLMYYDAARYAEYLDANATGQYAGVGVLFAEYSGRTYAADVFDGSAAQQAGVQRGDYVVSIDGDETHDWTLAEVVSALSRDEMDVVNITWMRPSDSDAATGERFTTRLVFSQYSEPNVATSLSGSVGVIKLQQLTQNASTLVKQAVSELQEEGAAGFVLDLRDNPGGYLTQAIDTASLFLKSGVAVQVVTVDGTSSKSVSGVTATTAPLVVLVNEYTAGGAEVLTAALQDNNRATVVGAPTMGKGSVLMVEALSFGGALRYTAAFYKTPLGHTISGTGIVPDVVSADNVDNLDAQLSDAVSVVENLIAGEDAQDAVGETAD